MERAVTGSGGQFAADRPAARPRCRSRRWSILLVIDVVVAAFVGLQLAYLFGGLDTLAAIGMTYSDYARRGFFELVAAACLAGAVVVGLETTGRAPKPAVPRRAARPGRALGGRGPGVRGDAPAALPGRLRLDRAAPVRLRGDRRAGGRAGRRGGARRREPDALARAMGWPSSASSRWSGSTCSRRRRSSRSATSRGSSIRRSCRPTARPPSTPTTCRCCRTTPSRPSWPRCRACRTRNAPRSCGSSTSAGSSVATDPAYTVAGRLEPGSRAGEGRPRDTAVTRTYTPAMALHLPFEPPLEPMLAKATDSPARRRRLAVRAQVGRLPGPRVP